MAPDCWKWGAELEEGLGEGREAKRTQKPLKNKAWKKCQFREKSSEQEKRYRVDTCIEL